MAIFRMDARNLNFNLSYTNDFEAEKLKNKMKKEYGKTIHDMVVINRFMKTNENTTKKLEGINWSAGKKSIISGFSIYVLKGGF